ncbi:MAG: type II toxin-antitoxin system HicB family antitoxin [Cyanobacteria bacterium]|nr:type II toxin-antitoxin system HicB family antitoxin [Cyanobacteria bacterium CG_2015-16_32_12]NCO77867.1 type II toxin-antitoxin system HicB family antitoxin [Cyanobacteria bacterium CG_2015-22_32_23]NCQ03070.1 type II toxin-antitoxin system HicB family antitoxin [Cyanobacteria bacterium CG_2015-09_32_10]NCQ41965.1 type II toxin-antitoxin system HicB family antitoxin [Cyanobacteria bacterium CG_2015-04_32_10]NCS84823.1 type II toxin-antitoxin system HicB family antitoxin [Cyanobacteria bact
MNYTIEIEEEEDGRYIAEIIELPGVLVYGNTQDEAVAKVQALTLRVLADQLEQREISEYQLNLSFVASGVNGLELKLNKF